MSGMALVPAWSAAASAQAEGVLDAASGVTRVELAAYYAVASELLLSQLRERPVTLMQFPEGIDGPSHRRTHAGPPVLRDVGALAAELDPAQPPLLEIRQATGLQSAARTASVELHSWNATVRAIRKPDRIVLALEPDDGVAWAQVRDGAALVHAALSDLGLKHFLKTSGSTGLHVVLPLMPSRSGQFVGQFARALVRHLVDTFPGRFVDAGTVRPALDGGAGGPRPIHAAANRVSHRGGKVRIDGQRNGWGASSLCAWSPSATPGLGISVPVGWDELDRLTGGAHWTLRNAGERIAVGNRPWEQYAVSRQGLAIAVKALGFTMTAELPRASPVPPGDRPMWLHDTPPVPELPPPPGPPPQPVTPEGDPIRPVTDPLSPGQAEPVREPPMTRPPASL